jgi:hypothetical protein
MKVPFMLSVAGIASEVEAWMYTLRLRFLRLRQQAAYAQDERTGVYPEPVEGLRMNGMDIA